MGEMFAVGLIFTAVAGLLSVPISYIWALAAGPAVKHLGRKWEEGRQRAAGAGIKKQAQAEEVGWGSCMLCGEPISDVDGSCLNCGKPVASKPRPQYTITGRPIR